MFKRVLIANRGEIAIRIARAAAALGMESVAVLRRPTRSRCTPGSRPRRCEIGETGADPLRAYLDIEAVIAAAKESGCDCVHPGYGFLAENAAFAERCARRGPDASSAPRPRRSRCSATRSRPARFAESLGIPVVARQRRAARLERRTPRRRRRRSAIR